MEDVGNLSGNSSSGSGLLLKQGYPTIITFILAYGFSFVLCVAGNLAVCVIVIKYQQLHTVTNFFIFNLAVADLLVALFCMPFTLVNNIHAVFPYKVSSCPEPLRKPWAHLSLIENSSRSLRTSEPKLASDNFRWSQEVQSNDLDIVLKVRLPMVVTTSVLECEWIFGDVVCKLSPFMQGVSVAASVFTLVAIAADRYVAVVRVPKSTIDGRQAAGIVLFIWILSATLSIPQAVVLETRTVEYSGVPVLACQEQWPSLTYRRVYTIALFLALFFTPLTIICYMYVKISKKLWPDNSSESGTPRCSGRRAAAANDRDSRMIWIVKMLLIVVILFAVSWLPLHVVTIVGDFGNLSTWHGTVLYDYVYPVAHWLAYLNSCMNPIVYGYFNKNFRRMMNEDPRKPGSSRNTDGKLGVHQTHIEMTERSVFNCTTPGTLRSVAVRITTASP
ncbi:G-protein coupled receptor [Branchiostoma belcheri]|nr:G-protein coupled receptor [Branchiostoma belcheri]